MNQSTAVIFYCEQEQGSAPRGSQRTGLPAVSCNARTSAAKAVPPAKFEFFTSEEAVEIEAITARIHSDRRNSRSAGSRYRLFIDRGLVTFEPRTKKRTARSGGTACESERDVSQRC